MAGPAFAGEDGADLGGEVDGFVEEGVVVSEAGGAAEGVAGFAYFRAFEEAFRAAELVGDAGVGEGLLVDLGLSVGAEQDGDLAGGDAVVDEGADAAGGAFGFGRFVGVVRVGGFWSSVPLGDEFEAVFGGAASGVGEEGVGEVDYLGGGAVVADEFDDGGVGVAGAEVEEVVGGGAGEGVDGLAGVADDAEVVAVAEPEFEESLLEGLTSWYSSTTKCWYWERTWSAMSWRSWRMPTVSRRTSSKSMRVRSRLSVS